MSRLFETYRPRVLADVVGQPPVAFLKALAANPYPCCLLLHGPPGVGKSASAYALAAELGCTDDMSGLYQLDSCDLTIDNVRELFADKLRLYPMCNPKGVWKVLIIEELESLNAKVDGKLKTALEVNLPAHLVVVATSNSPDKIGKALRQRFKQYQFKAGPEFAVASQHRLAAIWRSRAPNHPIPSDYLAWGWEDGVYSLRSALDQMQDHLTVLEGLYAA